MGGHDWFQVSASAMGILGVAGSDMGRDSAPPFRAEPTRLIVEISDVERYRPGGVWLEHFSSVVITMSCNLVKEAHELFHILPAPEELDFDSWAKYLVVKAKHDKSHEQQATAWECWIEREKVLELEREMERMRLELERKKKEEEEKEKELAKAAKKKVTTVIEVLIDDCWGCDACLRVGKSSFVSCEDNPLLIVQQIQRVLCVLVLMKVLVWRVCHAARSRSIATGLRGMPPKQQRPVQAQ